MVLLGWSGFIFGFYETFQMHIDPNFIFTAGGYYLLILVTEL
jgi:hypothetical protein